MRIRWEDFEQSGTSSIQDIYELAVLGKRASVNVNDYTQADTFDCELDYKEFPFDPRCIRAVGVTIAMQDQGKMFKTNNGLNLIQPRADVYDKNGNLIPGNVIFQGFADDSTITFDDSKRTVRLEGRDFTSLLIDRKYLKGAVDLTQTVDTVLKTILADLAETAKIELINKVEGDLPILSKFWGEQDILAGKRSVKKDESYWDVIQDIVARAGLIAYIELDKLILSKPRILYDKSKAKKFVYGKNLSQLEFKRKIGRRKNFNVIVRSMNLNTKEVLSAKIPAEGTEVWSVSSGIANKEVTLPTLKSDGTGAGVQESPQVAPYISFRVADVADKDHLVLVGQEIYEEMSRQQLEGSFSTKEMATSDKSGNRFDLLGLRNGTPIEIEIDQSDLQRLKRITTVEERARFLISRGYSTRIAQIFAANLGRFSTTFYTKAVTFTLDENQGFECKVEFINFIETTNRALAEVK